MKKGTIPRLELTAAMLAVKIDTILKTELQTPLANSVFWTDSTSVLKYIRNDTKRFQTFVANRVGVIRESTDIDQWRHIATERNPADLASRGMTAEAFLKPNVWISGPRFLLGTEENWPFSPVDLGIISHDDPEVKKDKAITVNVIQASEPSPTNQLIHYFSTWTKLQRAVAWFLRLKNLLQSLRNGRKKSTAIMPEVGSQMKAFKGSMGPPKLTLGDLRSADDAIVKFCQVQSFPDEIASLKSETRNVKRQSPIFKLDPKLDNGILRVGGRLIKLAMPEETKHPVILAKNHHVSRLFLENIHRQIGHCGRNYMLSVLRQKYWIPCANALSRTIINDCVKCRRLRGDVGEQKMAVLPRDRITPDLPPFTNVGVDYFGPIEV